MLRRFQINRTIQALSRLDDQILKDIGMSRGDIIYKANKLYSD